MSPFLSTARLGMNRFVASGDQVDCCAGAAPPAGTDSWYHRICAAFGERPPPTVWVSHSDSAPFRFVYWFCIINRYDSVSMLLPPCSGTSDGPTLKLATGTSVGPDRVELPVLAQSTWNFHTRIAYEPQIEAK